MAAGQSAENEASFTLGRENLAIPAIQPGQPASIGSVLEFFHSFWEANGWDLYGFSNRVYDQRPETVLPEAADKPLIVVRSEFTVVKEETLIRARWEKRANPNATHTTASEKHSVLTAPENRGSFKELVVVHKTYTAGGSGYGAFDKDFTAYLEDERIKGDLPESTPEPDSADERHELRVANFNVGLGKLLERTVELLG